MKQRIFLALVLLLIPTLAQAQFSQGDWDLTLSGSGFSNEDFDATTLSAVGTLGHFLTDQIEVNVRQGLSFADSEASSDFAGSTAAGADFHFALSETVIPFVGGAIGYRYGDGIDSDFYATPEAGVKYFVNSTTYVFGSVGYQFGWDNDADDDLWVYALGVGFRW